MTRNRNLINSLYLIIQPLLLNIISIPATAYIVRGLGPLGYGQWATAVSLVAILFFFTSLGLRPQFVRGVAQNPADAHLCLADQLGIRLLLSLITVFLTFVITLCLLHDPVLRTCILISCVGLLFMAANSIFTDFLQGVKQIGQYVVINLISGIALTATTVIAVALQKGAIGVATSYLVGPITSFILLIMVLHRLGISIKVRFDKSVMCSTLKQSGSWTASSFLTILRDRLEQMLIPHLVGMQAMGYYTAGSMPTDKLQIVPDGLATAFYPAVASGTDASQQRHAIHQVVVLCTIICVAFAILLYVLAKPLAQFLFPHSPFACQHVIQITALALPFIGLTYPVSSCLVAAGRQNQVSRVTMYATCFSMAGSLIIIMHSGLAGACWSYVMRYVVSVLFLLPCLAREFPGLLPRLPLLRIVISTGATVMLMQLSIFAAKTLSGSRIIHFGDSALCVMVGTSSLMFFIAMLFIVGVLRKSEIALLIGKPGRTVV